MKRLAQVIATGGFVGYAPLAPGTVGTLVAVAIAWAFGRCGALAMPIGAAFASAVGVWAAGVYEAEVGERDPSAVVIDEIAGFLAAMVGLPVSWPQLATVFVLFRLFDIAKPFPVRAVERVPGGAGIVADDLVAGLYANLTARLLLGSGVFPFTAG